MVCTKQLNIFPAKGGISPYYSPHVLLDGRQYDYEKDYQVQFGSYVQANNNVNPTNTNAPRTIDGIYLRPDSNIQGGHQVMSLSTGLVIYPRKVTVIPITDSIIKLVEKMGYDQGIKSLKLKNRKKNIFYPVEWTPGVDFEENEDEDDEDYEHNDNENDKMMKI